MTSFTASELQTVITTHIHPFVMKTILVDRHVEYRLEELIDVEKCFNDQFGHSLFIQCDLESNLVVYEIASMGVIFSCAFGGNE